MKPLKTVKNCRDEVLIWIDRTDVPEYAVPHVVKRKAQHQELVKHACGVDTKIACGTNACSMLSPYGSAGREVTPFMNCGLMPVRAIIGATRRMAELLYVGDRFETLAVGKRTDVVVEEENPTTNVATLETPGKLYALITEGSYLTAAGSVPRRGIGRRKSERRVVLVPTAGGRQFLPTRHVKQRNPPAAQPGRTAANLKPLRGRKRCRTRSD